MAELNERQSLERTTERDVWERLRRWTPARIGLGRVGASQTTAALLDFDLAHARARDAVHAAFDAEALAREAYAAGFGEAVAVSSLARDRMEYLLRPDLGRRLDAESRERLIGARGAGPGGVVAVIADGLSAVAPQRHALPVLQALCEPTPPRETAHRSGSRPEAESLQNVTVVVASQARVALGDEIGEVLGAEAVVVLIGERPGLSSPDSLGIYLTWNPRVGRTDAERNCLSNVRPEGLSYGEAAQRLAHLLREARRLGLSGVGLKDDSEIVRLAGGH